MKPTNVKRIAVHVLVVFALAAISTALADGSGGGGRPGGGYTEQIVMQPFGLDSFGMPTGGGFPYHIAQF
jgi:hypothetical protein